MRVVIADDEPMALRRLNRLLSEIDHCFVVGSAENGVEALEQVDKHQPDVVVLDINMPGVNGLDLAEAINQMPVPPAIIFATAYDEFALEAFKVNAVDYLVKPFDVAKLRDALAKTQRLSRPQTQAMEKQKRQTAQNITARTGDKVVLIPLMEVRFFQAEQKYVEVHHLKGTHLIDEPLKALEEKDTDNFIRIHRSTLVGKQYVKGLEKDKQGKHQLILDDQSRVEISRRHLADVRKWFKSL